MTDVGKDSKRGILLNETKTTKLYLKTNVYSALIELRLVALAQMENDFEFIELELVVPTQMENGFELVELELVVLNETVLKTTRLLFIFILVLEELL